MTTVWDSNEYKLTLFLWNGNVENIDKMYNVTDFMLIDWDQEPNSNNGDRQIISLICLEVVHIWCLCK